MNNYEVVIKEVAPVKVASIREKLPNYYAIGDLYKELTGYVSSFGMKEDALFYAFWHDPEYKETDVDGEAAVDVGDNVPSSDRVRVYDLPAVETMASLIHKGSYKNLIQAYNHITGWIQENGYQIVGHSREIYIVMGMEDDNDSYITEIQFPVIKA
jgi:effector-binding domain-containing protein